ncbi:uncharacterized protein ALTATR162_LOCUS11694 [Alternaria atra]|uniref:Uncharacterized protein n=1 Tax=Alternaria atra TaxID=119953 RepID=A0A8J2N7N2_9PLEO|nr:uncharacterized protein ALTATR162_LOCUS11694 [Alternaria atra]CAG5186754.1 unnamed protein product [Alternaria atra]
MAGTIQTPQPNGDAPSRRGIYFLTHPRSASNLFQTMMSKQPGYQNSGYKLFDAGFATLAQLEQGKVSEMLEEEREKLYEMFRTAFGKLEDELDDCAKNGKQAFIKEHTLFLSAPDKISSSAYPGDNPPLLTVYRRNEPHDANTIYTNPTSVPDSFLLSLQPIFIIRHPILMFPSMLRTQKGWRPDPHPSSPYCRIFLNLRHSRALYDWYLEHGASADIMPRVIDADDIMLNPAAERQLCEQTGLHADNVQYEWDERKIETPRQARFLGTISASRGIKPGLEAKGKSLEEEREKWVQEFGEEDAEDLARFVNDAMEDYKYLHSKRTTGDLVEA